MEYNKSVVTTRGYHFVLVAKKRKEKKMDYEFYATREDNAQEKERQREERSDFFPFNQSFLDDYYESKGLK